MCVMDLPGAVAPAVRGGGTLVPAPSGSFPSEGFLCPVVSQHGLVLRVRRGRAWFQGVLPGVPHVCVCVCAAWCVRVCAYGVLRVACVCVRE